MICVHEKIDDASSMASGVHGHLLEVAGHPPAADITTRRTTQHQEHRLDRIYNL